MAIFFINSFCYNRQQTISQTANIMSEFSKELTQFNPYFKDWYVSVDKNIYAPWEKIHGSVDDFKRCILSGFPKRKQPDTDSFLSEGHNLLMSNNNEAKSSDSIRVSAGWASHRVPDVISLNFKDEKIVFDYAQSIELLKIIVKYWHPDSIIFTSRIMFEKVDFSVGTIYTGWLTYISKDKLKVSIPEDYEQIEIEGKGVIIRSYDKEIVEDEVSENDIVRVKKLHQIINQI